MKDLTRKTMDLKLGFCVLSLNLLILLVTYGIEARKMAGGDMGKRLNLPIANEVVQRTNVYFWIYDNQGETGYGKTGNVQVQLSSDDKDLENKDDNHFWMYNNQDENGISEKENRQVQSSNNMELKNKVDTHFWMYNNPGENGENRQVQSSNKLELENKVDTHYWMYNNQGENAQLETKMIYDKQGENNHQQARNKNDYFWIYDRQGENKHQQAKKESAHLRIYEKLGENNHEQAKRKNAHAHSSSHMDHMDPSLMVFFLMDDLKLGNSITVHFPRRDLSPSPSFLPREEADSIPFSLKELPILLQQFNFSRNSPQAKAMEDTLRECEVPPIKGETKYCATSSESMLDFVQGIMGKKIQFKALSTSHFTNSAPLLQKYTILDVPQEVAAPKMVACHTMPYAYAIYYCHYTISKSKVFKVSLGGENGDRVEAIAVCHLDTSAWSPNHVSFRVLGILPGTSPICHFFPTDHLVWVPKITSGAQDH